MDVAECRESLLMNYSTLDETKPERQGQGCTSRDQGAEARSTVSRQLPDPIPGVMPREAMCDEVQMRELAQEHVLHMRAQTV